MTSLLLLLLFARIRPSAPPTGLPPLTGRIVWVGAHPDDEVLIAPLLGQHCVQAGQPCTLVVATRGESGVCGLPLGCAHNLGGVRTSEMQQAALLFGAQLEQLSLPNSEATITTDEVKRRWSDAAQLQRIEDAVATADVVITFDPLHGSSCHPEHIAIGELATGAAMRHGKRLVYVETRSAAAVDGYVFSAAYAGAPAIDANGTWSYLLDDVAIHASQFNKLQRDSLAVQPRDQRYVWLVDAAARPANAARCP